MVLPLDHSIFLFIFFFFLILRKQNTTTNYQNECMVKRNIIINLLICNNKRLSILGTIIAKKNYEVGWSIKISRECEIKKTSYRRIYLLYKYLEKKKQFTSTTKSNTLITCKSYNVLIFCFVLLSTFLTLSIDWNAAKEMLENDLRCGDFAEMLFIERSE